MPYSHYPSSGSAQHAGRSVPDDGPGSFGPVLVVMAVISFLAVAACVAGRLCGRASPTPSRGNSSGPQSAEADDKGAAKHLEVMRPLPISRATVHDVDDAFEIRLVPHKPGAGSEASGGGGSGRSTGCQGSGKCQEWCSGASPSAVWAWSVVVRPCTAT